MSFHRACCCESGCTCTGCEFATSYQTACMGWLVNWSYDPKTANPCVGCVDISEEPVIHEVQVTATYFFRVGPLTRTGPGQLGDCCYTRVGICDVTYSVTVNDIGDCCQDSSPCLVTNTYSGTKEISYLLTVTKICLPDNSCKWLHTVSVCPIALGLGEHLFNLGTADCSSGPLDCNNLPLDRVGVYLNGGLFQWMTDFVALDSLVYPSDFVPAAQCPSESSGAVCTYAHLADREPFSVMFVTDSAYDPSPACPLPANAITYYFSSTRGDCSGLDNGVADPCLGSYVIDTACCLKEYTANGNPPCYT